MSLYRATIAELFNHQVYQQPINEDLYNLLESLYNEECELDDYNLLKQIYILLSDEVDDEEYYDFGLIVAEFSAHLHENDISNLDFRKPIFIETPYGNAYFKLINVEYRNSETISKIRVMKIVN